ncbi:MAG: S-layer homology domain-containing protein, partial [Actinomycetota bacterium]|nr:S-layer homology domain-containing protein [Actinomycetota bacterium]
QMAAFLVRALDLTDDGGGNTFADVAPGSTFESDIAKLATAGITKGCNPPANTNFCPSDDVTREQMAAFLVRALTLTDTGDGNTFIDVAPGSTFESDIAKLATAGITKGCNPPANTMFCPGDNVTRGQMAAFLHRALGT